MTPITCDDALPSRNRLLVDIRPREERWLVGFIPGSIGMGEGVLQPSASVREVVLVCTTGTRARALASRLARPSIHYLEGGVLAWTDAGLPAVSAHHAVTDAGGLRSFTDLAHAYGALRSCFVAELVHYDMSKIEDGQLDPVSLFEVAAKRAGITSPIRPDHLLDMMDHLAENRLRLGADLGRIAGNLTLFGNLVRQITDPSPISVRATPHHSPSPR